MVCSLQEIPIDLKEDVAEEERAISDVWLKVEQLLKTEGTIDLEKFPALYQTTFGVEFSCPLKTDHSLWLCLKKHFNQIKVSSSVSGENRISLVADPKMHPDASSRTLQRAEHVAEFPPRAEDAKTAKHRKQPRRVKSSRLKKLSHGKASNLNGGETDRLNSVVPIRIESPMEVLFSMFSQYFFLLTWYDLNLPRKNFVNTTFP